MERPTRAVAVRARRVVVLLMEWLMVFMSFGVLAEFETRRVTGCFEGSAGIGEDESTGIGRVVCLPLDDEASHTPTESWEELSFTEGFSATLTQT